MIGSLIVASRKPEWQSMGKDRELNINLYVITDNSHQGPISFGTYEHHTFRLLSNWAPALGVTPGDYRAFRPATDEFADMDRAFRDLKVKEGEPVVLVKGMDLETVRLVWKVIRPAGSAVGPRPASSAPPVNVGLGITGPTISTDIMAWGRRWRDKIRGRFR
jgi:hypothetical protein